MKSNPGSVLMIRVKFNHSHQSLACKQEYHGVIMNMKNIKELPKHVWSGVGKKVNIIVYCALTSW